MEIIKGLLMKAIAGTSGVWGWLLKILLDYIWPKLVEGGKTLIRKAQGAKAVKENTKKLEEVIEKPEVKDEEIAEASEDLLNGRRK